MCVFTVEHDDVGNNGKYYWIGAKKESDGWQWGDGSKFSSKSYDKKIWYNPGSSGDCAYSSGKIGYKWKKKSCEDNDSSISYICEGTPQIYFFSLRCMYPEKKKFELVKPKNLK